MYYQVLSGVLYLASQQVRDPYKSVKLPHVTTVLITLTLPTVAKYVEISRRHLQIRKITARNYEHLPGTRYIT